MNNIYRFFRSIDIHPHDNVNSFKYNYDNNQSIFISRYGLFRDTYIKGNIYLAPWGNDILYCKNIIKTNNASEANTSIPKLIANYRLSLYKQFGPFDTYEFAKPCSLFFMSYDSKNPRDTYYSSPGFIYNDHAYIYHNSTDHFKIKLSATKYFESLKTVFWTNVLLDYTNLEIAIILNNLNPIQFVLMSLGYINPYDHKKRLKSNYGFKEITNLSEMKDFLYRDERIIR